MLSLLSAWIGLAGVALACGQAGRAARLLGAIEAGRESVGIKRINAFHAERIAAEIRVALANDEFEWAWSAGHGLSVDEAVSEALAIAGEVAAGENPAPTSSP